MALGRKTGGREKGTPNKATKALKEMILGALSDAGGQQYLARIAAEQPAAFLTLLGKVLPTTIAGDKETPLQTASRIEVVVVKAQPTAVFHNGEDGIPMRSADPEREVVPVAAGYGGNAAVGCTAAPSAAALRWVTATR